MKSTRQCTVLYFSSTHSASQCSAVQCSEFQLGLKAHRAACDASQGKCEAVHAAFCPFSALHTAISTYIASKYGWTIHRGCSFKYCWADMFMVKIYFTFILAYLRKLAWDHKQVKWWKSQISDIMGQYWLVWPYEQIGLKPIFQDIKLVY